MRQLLFTECNETWLREYLFRQWTVYYARRRWRTLRDVEELDNDPTAFGQMFELVKSRYYQEPAPTDLSGACKVAAQIAVKLFALDGEVVSNARHTFVVMRSGQIYDFNRYCRDANAMRLFKRDPYEVDSAFSQSSRAVTGRESWAPFISRLLKGWPKYLSTKPIVLLHRGPPVTELPAWALIPPAPTTRFPRWGVQQQELA